MRRFKMEGLAIKLNFDDYENVEMNTSFVDPGLSNNPDLNYYYNTTKEGANNPFSCITSSPPEHIFSPRKDSKLVHSCQSSDSPPYKRIRALRLFDSPATPKTLLEKCAADSTSAHRPRLRPANTQNDNNEKKSSVCQSKECNISQDNLNNNCKCNSKGNGALPVANVNPFTPVLSFGSSKKRARSNGCLNKSICSDTSMLMDISAADLSLNDTSMLQAASDGEVCSPAAAGADSSPKSDPETPSVRLSIHDANVSRYHEEFLELSLIGRGQFGSVYKCRHRLDGCDYAIKKSLKPVAGSATERIALTEVYAHAVLGKHPHVVRYYSAWAENDHMIIQNEYCTGGSLAELLESNKKTQTNFTESQLKQILLHIAKGLRYIHHCNLVHMDIKPGNIFISHEPQFGSQGEDSADDGFEEECDHEESDDVVYKIGDLGHVTSVKSHKVEEGDCRYLPREILQEEFSHLQKADIFALGLTVYECATGGPLPHNGDEWHSLRDGNLPEIPNTSTDLQILLRAMIHPDPSERPTAAHLIQQLSFCGVVNKSHAQLRRELNAERFKNQVLSRQLLEAAKCLQSISPNVTSSYTAAVATGVLAGVGPASVQSRGGQPSRSHDLRPGPTTRYANSRLVGKRVNRSVSATNF